jgi:hypothetical protein
MTIKGIASKITENTGISIGLILTAVGLIGPPFYKAFAKIDTVEAQVKINTDDIKSLKLMNDNVNYIKGVVETIEKRGRK